MNFCGAYGLIRQAAAVATTRSAGFDVAGGLMLIAILSDIHGNREALDACLAQAARMRAERYVFLGDLVGYGADPCYVVDTVARRMESGAVALLGNHDEAIAGSCEGFNPDAKAASSGRGGISTASRLPSWPRCPSRGQRASGSSCTPTLVLRAHGTTWSTPWMPSAA